MLESQMKGKIRIMLSLACYLACLCSKNVGEVGALLKLGDAMPYWFSSRKCFACPNIADPIIAGRRREQLVSAQHKKEELLPHIVLGQLQGKELQ